MNLPPAMAVWLRSEGHDAVHARELNLEAAPDSDVFAVAAADSRFIVTFDLDFADLAVSAGGSGTGVILLRLRSPRQAHLRERLRSALALAEKALQSGAIVLVEDTRTRVRALGSEADPTG